MKLHDPQFALHNSHLEDPSTFMERDPHLRALSRRLYHYSSPLLTQLPQHIPGVYTVSGGRQIGKTTLMKQWMLHLLQQGVQPQCIAYFTGEIIVDHIALIKQLQAYLDQLPQGMMKYFIVDEVTYIQEWEKGVKFLADGGVLEEVTLVLTGSDSVIIQEARMGFPGRRGRSHVVDFHLHPLSFYELIKLVGDYEDLDGLLQGTEVKSQDFFDSLEQHFHQYLYHGGYLAAINDYYENSCIDPSVLSTYGDWVRGDMIRHGKKDHYCREFFMAMLKHLNSQVTWQSLAQNFAIEHHQTVADYAETLMSLDAVFIQQALLEDKLVGSPKKAKKLFFTDPFIYHAINSWLYPVKDPFTTHMVAALENPHIVAYLVETVVVNHFRRWYPIYYIKAEGEVDVAYIHEKRFWPVEVKWTQQLRNKDLKQIQKYNNGIILSKQRHGSSNHEGLPRYHLPWYLAYQHSLYNE